MCSLFSHNCTFSSFGGAQSHFKFTPSFVTCHRPSAISLSFISHTSSRLPFTHSKKKEIVDILPMMTCARISFRRRGLYLLFIFRKLFDFFTVHWTFLLIYFRSVLGQNIKAHIRGICLGRQFASFIKVLLIVERIRANTGFYFVPSFVRLTVSSILKSYYTPLHPTPTPHHPVAT